VKNDTTDLQKCITKLEWMLKMVTSSLGMSFQGSFAKGQSHSSKSSFSNNNGSSGSSGGFTYSHPYYVTQPSSGKSSPVQIGNLDNAMSILLQSLWTWRNRLYKTMKVVIPAGKFAPIMFVREPNVMNPFLQLRVTNHWHTRSFHLICQLCHCQNILVCHPLKRGRS
jgi:hypothetical protein